MSKTPEEFIQAAIDRNLTQWPIHNCSMCGYPCSYVMPANNRSKVFYDSGCDCVTYTNVQPRSWQDIADHYNSQTNPVFIAEMNLFWGFSSGL